jgi:hypothetical protein
MKPAVRRTFVNVDIGNCREPVGLLVNVTVLAARGEVAEAFWAARTGELATRISVWHVSPFKIIDLEGFDEGFDPTWPNDSRKARTLVSHTRS